MSKLDLRYNSIIQDKQLNKSFRKISNNNRKYYFNLIDEFNYLNSTNLLWLSSITSSRNIFSSKIFYYISLRIFIKENIKTISGYKKILLDNKIIMNLLIDMSINQNKLILYKTNYFIYLLKKLKYVSMNIFSIIFFKIFMNSKKINNNSIFIQLPISKKYTINNSIGNFKKYIDKDDLKKVIFIPFLINKNFKEYINIIKVNKIENILFKQNFLSLKDHFKILCSILNFSVLQIPKSFSFIDKQLIFDEYTENIISPSSFDCLEYNTFIEKLSKNSNNDYKFVSIFENSSLNKIWNFSIHKNFQKTINNAIKVMIPIKNYFSQYYVLKSEMKLHLLPNKIFISSKMLKDQLIKDNMHIKNLYHNGPSIRSHNNLVKNKIKAVVFFTSILNFETSLILKYLNKVDFNNDYKYFIKFHPSIEKNMQNKYMKYAPSKFSVNNTLNISQLNSESIIISGMSSIIIDSINANIKNIYVDTGFYLSLNPVLDKLKKINNNHYSSTLEDLGLKIKNLKEKKIISSNTFTIYNQTNKNTVKRVLN